MEILRLKYLKPEGAKQKNKTKARGKFFSGSFRKFDSPKTHADLTNQLLANRVTNFAHARQKIERLSVHRGSPAKNVWLVDARPRDISKFKMAAIPPSFVYSSGKKINCRLIWVANAYTDFLRIAQTFYYPFSPIPMGFVPCDARVLAGLPDSALDLFKRSLFKITKDNNISDKSRVTRKNGLCWQLNAAEK